MVTSTIPTWQSECAKPEDRGFLIMNEGMLIGFGIMVSYWVDYGFYFLEGGIRWRFPIAFQAIFSFIVILGVFILPDSPRWLLKKNRNEEAREVVARLADEDVGSEKVDEEMAILEHTLALEGQKFSYREFLRHGNVQHFRRMMLGVVAQAMQQFCGINLITYVYLHFCIVYVEISFFLLYKNLSSNRFLHKLYSYKVLCYYALRRITWFRCCHVSSLGSHQRY